MIRGKKIIYKRIFSIASIISAFALTLGAQAADYQDWWWNPNEAGHGLNIGQQGNTLFIAWFMYDEKGDGMWLTLAGQPSDNVISGDLIYSTGPPLGQVFDTHAVVGTVVGQATLTFTDLHHANFSYTVNGISGSVQLQRFSFAPVPANGWYAGVAFLNATGCSFNPDGLYPDLSNYRISTREPNITITTESLEHPNSRCTYSGAYQQHGSKLAASGTFSCISGLEGTWSASELIFNKHGFIGEVVFQDTVGETCRHSGSVSATRY